jgi:hypothetical protein
MKMLLVKSKHMGGQLLGRQMSKLSKTKRFHNYASWETAGGYLYLLQHYGLLRQDETATQRLKNLLMLDSNFNMFQETAGGALRH